MDIHRLKTFKTAATLLNFNRTADALHYSQSTVSAQIKTLEDEIGVLLFERNGKHLSLTEAGEKMLNYSLKLLAIHEEAISDITGRCEPAGIMTIRAPQTVTTYHLPCVLAEFQPRFPKVRFDVTSCALYSLEHELQIGTVDLAFLLAESVQAANLNVEMLKAEQLVIVAKPDHPLSSKKHIGFKELGGQHIFLPKADCGYRMSFEQSLMIEKAEPAFIMEFNSIEAIKKCVMTGLGITVIPEIAVRDELKQGYLARLDWSEESEVAVLMIWHKEKWISPTLGAFMETMRKMIK
ncbi:MAG: LysR family transcriptional regulator [Desulfobacteraceae bacterium]|nr:LysR family transcriptional regulator [Desulfobacteraceae bacterium]